VGGNDTGRFVVVWTNSQAQDGMGSGIFGQRYNALGTKAGAEFQVNAVGSGFQRTPDIAVLPDGSFITAWTEASDGSETSIAARRFGDDGVPLAGNFTVNSGTAGYQVLPAISADDDGSFVVTFASYGGDDGNDDGTAGVFARRFDADGAAIGDDFQVNTYTTGNQTDPDVGVQPAVASSWCGRTAAERSSIVGRIYDARHRCGRRDRHQSDATSSRRIPNIARR
jgi:hypothetical protein